MPDALHAKNDESVHTMTLRLPDGLYEVIRKRAFDERTTITSQIVVALREQFRTWGLGCDVCGKAHVEVSTPGGFRFCAEHGTGSAPSTAPNHTSREEMREIITADLLRWKAEGYTDPVMPVYSDLDGDGEPDFLALTADGELETLTRAEVVRTADGVWVRGGEVD